MTETEKLIQSAQSAIGVNEQTSDRMISTTEHAAMFEEKAPTLALNLLGSRPKGLSEIYTEKEKEADKAQKRFKRTMTLAHTAVFFTATFSTLLMVSVGITNFLNEHSRSILQIIGISGALTAAVATVWFKLISGSALSGQWAQKHIRAEHYRLEYFKAIINGAAETPQDQLLVLEYTRRFLLDNKIHFFKEHGAKHGAAADKALKKSSLTILCTSLFTIGAGGLACWKSEFALIAGLGILTSAYGTLVMSQSAVNLDRRNAGRYAEAAYQLKIRMLDIDECRQKVAAGNSEAVTEFFSPVFAILEAGHQAFVEDEERRDLAISDLEISIESTPGTDR